MAGRYVKDFVGNMLKECGDLGGGDLAALAGGRIMVDHCEVVIWCAKDMGALNYVQACLSGTHPAGVC